MADEVKRCEVCGESGCWALADWSMGGAPGEYEEAMAKHYRLGYEREKARAEKAEVDVEAVATTLEDEQVAHRETLDLLSAADARADAAEEAIAAARRECDGLRKWRRPAVCAICQSQLFCVNPECRPMDGMHDAILAEPTK